MMSLLNCQDLSQVNHADIEIEYAYASDLMSDILASAFPGALLLTGLSNNQAIRTCQISGICAIVFVRNKKPDDNTIKLAQECELPSFITELSMFDASGILFSNGIKGIPKKKKS